MESVNTSTAQNATDNNTAASADLDSTADRSSMHTQHMNKSLFISKELPYLQQHSHKHLQDLPLVGLKHDTPIYTFSLAIVEVSQVVKLLVVSKITQNSLVQNIRQSLTLLSDQLANFDNNSYPKVSNSDFKSTNQSIPSQREFPLVGLRHRDSNSKLLHALFTAVHKLSQASPRSKKLLHNCFDNFLGSDGVLTTSSTEIHPPVDMRTDLNLRTSMDGDFEFENSRNEMSVGGKREMEEGGDRSLLPPSCDTDSTPSSNLSDATKPFDSQFLLLAGKAPEFPGMSLMAKVVAGFETRGLLVLPGDCALCEGGGPVGGEVVREMVEGESGKKNEGMCMC